MTPLAQRALGVLGAVSLTAIIYLWRRRRAPDERRRCDSSSRAPWTGFDVAVVLLAYLVMGMGARAGVQYFGHLLSDPTAQGDPIKDLAAGVAARAGAQLLAALFALVRLRWTAGASWAQLGFARGFLWADLGRGLLTFCAVAAPLYLAQGLLQLLFPSPGHPALRMLVDHPSGLLAAVVIASAVVVAPVVEELIFRVVLQGFLQGALADRPGGIGLAIGSTSVVFAPLHPWPDMIPLFVFSAVLGHLYWKRDGRITPSLAAHAALNACTFALLFLGAAGEPN